MRKLWSTALIAAAALSAACTNTIVDDEPGDVTLDPWVRSYGGTITPSAIASGPDGDLLLGGTFTGSANFGAGPLPAEPKGSIFMAHLDPAGGHLFSASTGSQDNVLSTAIGPGGDLYLAGHFDGYINFGKGKINATSVGYLATFKEDGTSSYALTMDGASSVSVEHVRTLPSGDIIIAARGDDSVDYGAGASPQPTGQQELAVVAYRPGGTHRWSVRLPGASVNGSGLATDSDGNVLFTATSFNPITVAGQAVQPGAFVLKLSPEGELLWLRLAAGMDGDFPYVRDLSVDGDNNVYFCGFDYAGFTFEGVSVPATQNQNAFVIKAGPDGKGVYAKTLTADNYVQDIRCKGTPAGDVIVTATYYGSVDFGGGPVGTGASYNTALARYAPDGELTRAAVLDGSGTEYIFAMTIDPTDKPVIAGTFDGVLDIGKTRLIADTGQPRMFLARLDL